MVAYVVGCWMFGLVWVGLLSALAPAELAWVAAIGRAVYVGGVALVLVVTAVIVGASSSFAELSPSRTGLWAYSVGAAIPVMLLAFLVVRPTVPHPRLVALGTLPAAAFVLAAPEAFRQWGTKLDGLALTVHDHHMLVVAAIALCVACAAAAVSLPARDAASAAAAT